MSYFQQTKVQQKQEAPATEEERQKFKYILIIIWLTPPHKMKLNSRRNSAEELILFLNEQKKRQ